MQQYSNYVELYNNAVEIAISRLCTEICVPIWMLYNSRTESQHCAGSLRELGFMCWHSTIQTAHKTCPYFHISELMFWQVDCGHSWHWTYIHVYPPTTYVFEATLAVEVKWSLQTLGPSHCSYT